MAKSPRRRRRRRWSRRVLAALAVVALIGLGSAGLWVAKLHRDVDAFLATRDLGGVRLYSAPFALRPGMDVEAAGLFRRLARLGYERRDVGPLEAGAWRRVGKQRLEIGL